MPLNQIEIPQLPARNEMTFNNINVSNSTLGVINLGTAKNIDSAISIFKAEGNSETANLVNELVDAIMDSDELADTVKKEVTDQIAYLVADLRASPDKRSQGITKSVMEGVARALLTAPALVDLWTRFEELFRSGGGGAT